MSTTSSNKLITTRYAPSPTGNLHVGGARTALFNYLYARKLNGKFILRIENTDIARNIVNGHESLENDLKLLNIYPDESFSTPGSRGPYLQSQKLERYKELAYKLLQEGKAYRCFCTECELEANRDNALKKGLPPVYSGKCRHLTSEDIQKKLDANFPFSIRLKMDIKSQYWWEDSIRGSIKMPADSLGDYIILRPSGIPTYNFAVVVDDYDMGITNVLRGEEHIANTPYQIATYFALNWESEMPKFGHLPIIVDVDKKKLSKRSPDERHFVSGLISKGYLPDAIVNFLALLGWSHGEKELFSVQELISCFDLDSVSKSPSFFDIDKLNWLNHKYIQQMDSEHYLNWLLSIFTIDLGPDNDKREMFALANKKSLYFGDQLNSWAKEFYEDRDFTDEQVNYMIDNSVLINLAKEYFPGREEDWTESTVRNYLKQLSEISGLKGKSFFKPLRIAFSKKDEGFELFNTLVCLGYDRAFRNISKAFDSVFEPLPDSEESQ